MASEFGQDDACGGSTRPHTCHGLLRLKSFGKRPDSDWGRKRSRSRDDVAGAVTSGRARCCAISEHIPR